MGEVVTLRLEADVLEEAAELIRLLGAAVRADLLQEEERLENLLRQVTESQCRALADDLDVFGAMARTSRRTLTSRPTSPSPAAGDRREGATPSPLPSVAYLDPYSRKV